MQDVEAQVAEQPLVLAHYGLYASLVARHRGVDDGVHVLGVAVLHIHAARLWKLDWVVVMLPVGRHLSKQVQPGRFRVFCCSCSGELRAYRLPACEVDVLLGVQRAQKILGRRHDFLERDDSFRAFGCEQVCVLVERADNLVEFGQRLDDSVLAVAAVEAGVYAFDAALKCFDTAGQVTFGTFEHTHPVVDAVHSSRLIDVFHELVKFA